MNHPATPAAGMTMIDKILARRAGDVPIDQAFVGSRANGKLEDLRVAAAVVRGRHVAPGVSFLVTPASQNVHLEAVKRGYVATLLEAGAVVTSSTCGACYGATWASSVRGTNK